METGDGSAGNDDEDKREKRRSALRMSLQRGSCELGPQDKKAGEDAGQPQVQK